MKLSELPQDVQNQLHKQLDKLANKHINDSYTIHVYNSNGTRYFYAHRFQHPYYDDKGNYMPYGGGSQWKVSYGRVQFHRTKNPLGEYEYELFDGKTYGKSANGTVIPSILNKKAEVIKLIKEIGIFTI